MTTLVAPAFLTVPARVGSFGDEAADLSATYGRSLDEEQRLACDVFNSYTAGGDWAALESAIIAPRQNGKTDGPVTASVMAELFLFDADSIIWTAHRVFALREAHTSVKAAIDGTPALSRRTKRVGESADDLCVELMSGASLKFLVRSGQAGRSLHSKTIVFDEALYLSGSMMGALIPTLATRRNARIIYASSAAKPESDQLHALIARGRSGDPTLGFVEYAASGSWADPGCARDGCSHELGVDGCRLDDEGAWAAASFALGRRITVDRLRKFRRAMPPLEFGREFLGWHESESAGEAVIPPAAWAACVDAESSPAGPVVFAVDMSPDGAVTSIGVAGRRVDGLVHVGVVDSRPGTAWVAPRLAELVERHTMASGGVVWQPAAPVGFLQPRFDESGIPLEPMTGAHMAAACGAFRDDVIAGRLRHQGGTVLDAAFAAAERRVGVEGSWTWTRRRSAGDISPLVAVTEALWGLSQAMSAEPSVFVI